MATNNLLQRLDVAADTTGSSAAASDRRLTEDFIASAAIAANALVSFDLSETEDSDKMLKVITADTGTATSSLCFGAALVAAAAANDRVNVITRGIATVAVKGDVTNVAIGDALHLVGTKLEKTAGAAGETPVAVALEAVTTDTTAKVYFTNRF